MCPKDSHLYVDKEISGSSFTKFSAYTTISYNVVLHFRHQEYFIASTMPSTTLLPRGTVQHVFATRVLSAPSLSSDAPPTRGSSFRFQCARPNGSGPERPLITARNQSTSVRPGVGDRSCQIMPLRPQMPQMADRARPKTAGLAFFHPSPVQRLIGSKDDRWTKPWHDYMKGHTRTKWRIIKRLFLFFTTLSVIPLTVLYLITSDHLYRFRQYTNEKETLPPPNLQPANGREIREIHYRLVSKPPCPGNYSWHASNFTE
ncbi:AGAP005721-PA-like protein [Anopheles sinensis]|uniref:AGAP005721-PA-like protein n=1 Tax=Anopheles sinensis TaxID=74873 RepID=A0A084WDM8_ANOSI|nr:AGAP005721-PA-like protein [Anopheles sinensis]